MRIQIFSMNKKLAYLSVIATLSCYIVAPVHAVETDAQLILKAQQALRYADEEIALDILKPLAEKGNSEAMMMLASRLLRPRNWNLRDEALANVMFEKAFNNNYPPAIAEKAGRYMRGDIKSDANGRVASSIPLFEDASNRGHASSSIMLANLFSNGKDIPADNSKAFSFAMRAFEQKGGSEVHTLANFYRDGIGTEPDLVKAYGLFFLTCHSLIGTCEEAEKIEIKLDKKQRKTAKIYIEDVLKKRTDLQVILPLDFDSALTNKTRADLLREYKTYSPLFSLAQYGNKEKYSTANRTAFAYILLLYQHLSLPGNQRNSTNKEWNNLFQKFLTQFASLDRERMKEMTKLLDDSQSLLKKIDKELSDDDLKYLIALYRSNNSKKMLRAFQLIKEIEEDGNARVWEKLAASGKDIDDINDFARNYFDAYQDALPESKREFDKECNYKYMDLRYKLSTVLGYVANGSSLGSFDLAWLHTVLSKQRKEWITFCVEDDYADLTTIFWWKPFQQEKKIIDTWKVETMRLPQVKEINAKFDAGLQKLFKDNK